MRLSKVSLPKILWVAAVSLLTIGMAGCSGSKSTTGKSTTHLTTNKKSGSSSSSSKSSGSKSSTSGSTSKSSTSGSSSSSSKSTGKVEKGQASYYADKFHGKATASGEKYDKTKLTGAHRTLAFGTVVRVTNTANGKSVDVRINDRGPFKAGRVVDVSRAAAEKLGMIQAGVINCTVEVISEP